MTLPRPRLSSVLLACSVACHSSGPAPTTAAVTTTARTTPDPALGTTRVPLADFVIQAVTVRRDGAPVAPHAELRSRDRFEIIVELSAPAFVYVVRVSPNQMISVLYPASTSPKLAAGATRLPTNPKQIFQLDDEIGIEHLYVIATSREFRDAGSAITDAVRSIEESGHTERTPPPPGPPSTPLSNAPRPAPQAESPRTAKNKPIVSRPVRVAETTPAPALADHDRDVMVVSIDSYGVCADIAPNTSGVAACQLTIRHAK